MARQSQLDPDLIRAIIAGQAPQQISFDPTKISEGIASGENLANTILKNKQAQEDRVTALRQKIDALKQEREYKQKAGTANPKIANEIGYIPKESAESILKANLAAQSDEAKLARAQLRQQQQSTQPDRIKQIFDVNGQPMAVTYGNKVVPVPVPGGAALNPLNKTLQAEQAEKSGTFQAMTDLVQRIREDITNPKTGQLSEEGKSYLGPVDTPTQLAASFTPKANVGFTNFHQKLADLKNQIIYLRSGKQINEQEYKRLRDSLPSEYRDESTFLSNLDNFQRTFEDVMAKRQQAFQQAGYKVSGNVPPTAPTGNPGKPSGFRVISVRPSGSK